MRLTYKIIITVAIAFVVILAIFMMLASSFAKKVIIRELEQKLGRNVNLESVSFSLPFSVNLSKLSIANYASANSVTIAPNPADLLKKKIFLNRLVIRGGRYIHSGGAGQPGPEGLTVIADNIHADVSGLALAPVSSRAKFNFSFGLAGAKGEKIGSVNASGWVDQAKKDMDATLQANNIEAVYFLPYYGDFISQRKLLSAKINLTADIKSVNNDLIAHCHFELSNLVYDDSEPAEKQMPSLDLLKNTLDLFIDAQGKLKLDFTVNTKFDNPHINPDKLKKLIFEAAAKNLASQPPEVLMEKVGNTIKQFEDFGQQMKDIFSK